ncbi:MAG: hypothetical protein JMDDDDMK_02458 [Acidobacteria bacterium]|nr:hypothetical protein [Acidobacteriota bacterium]
MAVGGAQSLRQPLFLFASVEGGHYAEAGFTLEKEAMSEAMQEDGNRVIINETGESFPNPCSGVKT